MTFPAASSVFTDRAAYDLSSGEYGLMFLPQTIMAISAALLGGRIEHRWGEKRVFLAGLVANLASMPCSSAVGSRSAPTLVAFTLLLVATALMGIGFGLMVPALNTLASALFPRRVNVAVLALNALLGMGTALAPLLVALFVHLGAWWGLPVAVGTLLAALFALERAVAARRGRRARGERRPVETFLALHRLRARLRRRRDVERQLGHPLHAGRAEGAGRPGVRRPHRVLGGRHRRSDPVRDHRALAPRPARRSACSPG